MKKLIASYLTLLSAFLLLPAIGSATKASADPTRVRVGHFSNITHAQGVIGHGNHWFEEALAPEAVVDWKIFNAGPSAIEALFAGQLDITYIGPSPAVNGYVKSEGEAVRIVAGSASGGASLVVRADADIADPSKDFHGRKVASPQLGNTQDVALRAWLLESGYRLKEKGGDVEVVPVANADQLTLFLKKEIDAAWTVEPWVSALVLNGGGKVLFDEASLWEDGKFSTTVVLVRTKFLKEHPWLVKRFLGTHLRLTDWINAHPEEAKQAFKAEFERETGREFAQNLLDEAWPRVRFSAEPLPATIQTQALAAHRAGFLKKEPDLGGLFDTALLQDVLAKKPKSDK